MDYSYRGKEVELFEKKISEYTKIPYVLATNTGTAALHLAYLCSGIKPNDEVLVPALTYVGTVNPLSYIGAIPHFIDSNKYYVIDAEKLKLYLENIVEKRDGISYNKLTGNKITALVAVHIFGNACELNKLIVICQEYGLRLIEDAAQALGTFYRKRHVGDFGDCGILSFNGNKILTTGGGGALLTHYKSLYDKAKHLSMAAKVDGRLQNYHDEIGFNYRMPAWNAKLGLKQLKKLKGNLKKSDEFYQKYKEKYDIKVPDYCKPNLWKNGVINKHVGLPVWELISNLPTYSHCPKMDLSNALFLENNLRYI